MFWICLDDEGEEVECTHTPIKSETVEVPEEQIPSNFNDFPGWIA